MTFLVCLHSNQQIPHAHGISIYGLSDDVFAVLPVDDMKELFYTKLETREYFKTVVTTIHTPVFMVSIHCVYLNFICCCLCCVHTSV